MFLESCNLYFDWGPYSVFWKALFRLCDNLIHINKTGFWCVLKIMLKRCHQWIVYLAIQFYIIQNVGIIVSSPRWEKQRPRVTLLLIELKLESLSSEPECEALTPAFCSSELWVTRLRLRPTMGRMSWLLIGSENVCHLTLTQSWIPRPQF